MPDLAHIYLGALTIRVHSRQPAVLAGPESPDTMAFRESPSPERRSSDEISVMLEWDNMPAISGMTMLLNGESSWSVFSQGGGQRVVRLKSPAADMPLWQMHLQRGSNNVVVYCGGSIISNTSTSVAIRNPVAYPADLILMMYTLTDRQGIIVHSTGISLNGKGLVFPGVSGAGKSTLTRLFSHLDRVTRLSDDRVILRHIDGKPRMFGTPWLGEAGVCANADAPLNAMLFLRKGPANRINKLSGKQAIERLLPVVSVPWYDPDTLGPIMETCETVVAAVPAYEFEFTPTVDAVTFIEKFAADL